MVPSWNINFHVGVDGISVAWSCLPLVVVAGVLVSWMLRRWLRNFISCWLCFLGVYGFYFTDLLFFSSFSKLLLFQSTCLLVSGEVAKAICCKQTGIDAHGWIGLDTVVLLGLYFSGDTRSLILFSYRKHIFRHLFRESASRFYLSGSVFSGPCFLSFNTLGAGWTLFRTNSRVDVPRRHIYETRVDTVACGLLLSCVTRGRPWVRKYCNHTFIHSYIVRSVCYDDAGLEIHQCLFICEPLRFWLPGIGMLTKTAVAGAVMQMVSHGVMTALFFVIGDDLWTNTYPAGEWDGRIAESNTFHQLSTFYCGIVFARFTRA